MLSFAAWASAARARDAESEIRNGAGQVVATMERATVMPATSTEQLPLPITRTRPRAHNEP